MGRSPARGHRAADRELQARGRPARRGAGADERRRRRSTTRSICAPRTTRRSPPSSRPPSRRASRRRRPRPPSRRGWPSSSAARGRTRSRRRRSAAPAAAAAGARAAAPATPLEGTFDHGEEGYGLWLDPAVVDDPVYAEHWAGHRPVDGDDRRGPDRHPSHRVTRGAAAASAGSPASGQSDAVAQVAVERGVDDPLLPGDRLRRARAATASGIVQALRAVVEVGQLLGGEARPSRRRSSATTLHAARPRREPRRPSRRCRPATAARRTRPQSQPSPATRPLSRDATAPRPTAIHERRQAANRLTVQRRRAARTRQHGPTYQRPPQAGRSPAGCEVSRGGTGPASSSAARDHVLVLARAHQPQVARLGVGRRRPAQRAFGLRPATRAACRSACSCAALLRFELHVGHERAQRADREVEQHREREQQRHAADAVPANACRSAVGLRPSGAAAIGISFAPRRRLLHGRRLTARRRLRPRSRKAASSPARSASSGSTPSARAHAHDHEQQLAERVEALRAAEPAPTPASALDTAGASATAAAPACLAGAPLHLRGERQRRQVLGHVARTARRRRGPRSCA